MTQNNQQFVKVIKQEGNEIWLEVIIPLNYIEVNFIVTKDKVITEREYLSSRITEYLGNGGFFNPEMMDHDKVRDLLMDIRVYLDKK